MEFDFEGEVVEWRGPAPFLFVPMPPELGAEIKALSSRLTYGWGCIPAEVTVGSSSVTTALFPRLGSYWVPVKVSLQRAEGIGLGSPVRVTVRLSTG